MSYAASFRLQPALTIEEATAMNGLAILSEVFELVDRAELRGYQTTQLASAQVRPRGDSVMDLGSKRQGLDRHADESVDFGERGQAMAVGQRRCPDLGEPLTARWEALPARQQTVFRACADISRRWWESHAWVVGIW